MGELSDERLLGSLRELLAAEGRSEARIVAHLAEVDERRIHLKACRAHNQLMAERDFGKPHVRRAIAERRLRQATAAPPTSHDAG